jgi:hypothetical protein
MGFPTMPPAATGGMHSHGTCGIGQSEGLDHIALRSSSFTVCSHTVNETDLLPHRGTIRLLGTRPVGDVRILVDFDAGKVNGCVSL